MFYWPVLKYQFAHHYPSGPGSVYEPRCPSACPRPGSIEGLRQSNTWNLSDFQRARNNSPFSREFCMLFGSVSSSIHLAACLCSFHLFLSLSVLHIFFGSGRHRCTVQFRLLLVKHLLLTGTGCHHRVTYRSRARRWQFFQHVSFQKNVHYFKLCYVAFLKLPSEVVSYWVFVDSGVPHRFSNPWRNPANKDRTCVYESTKCMNMHVFNTPT